MDTISRENNSMLPLGGLIVGVVALIVSAIAVFSLPNIKKQLADHTEKLSHLDDVAAQATSANSKVDALSTKLDGYVSQIQTNFNMVGTNIAEVKADLQKIQDGMKRPAHGAKGAKGEPAVAGPGEYIVKHGDTSGKIAHANGVSRSDLLEVNPGVNWARLHVGQKLKLPEKKAAAPAQP